MGKWRAYLASGVTSSTHKRASWFRQMRVPCPASGKRERRTARPGDEPEGFSTCTFFHRHIALRRPRPRTPGCRRTSWRRAWCLASHGGDGSLLLRPSDRSGRTRETLESGRGGTSRKEAAPRSPLPRFLPLRPGWPGSRERERGPDIQSPLRRRTKGAPRK